MKEIVEEALKKMITQIEKTEGDYMGEDGLTDCGECHTSKEAYFDQELAQKFGMKTHPKECDFRRKAREQVEALREQSRHEETVRSLKERYLSEKAMQEWSFNKNRGN